MVQFFEIFASRISSSTERGKDTGPSRLMGQQKYLTSSILEMRTGHHMGMKIVAVVTLIGLPEQRASYWRNVIVWNSMESKGKITFFLSWWRNISLCKLVL